MSKVILADPTHSLRAAFALLLRRRLGVTDIEEAADLERLDQAMKTTRPDLLVLDWGLAGSGLQALQRWQRQQPGLKIVVMSVCAEDALPARQAGADGFIHKGAPPEQALDSLQRCLAAANPSSR